MVKQAKMCLWDGYHMKVAAWNVILQQCDNKKLQRKVIVEDLNFEDIIKYGLAYEQAENKVTRVNKYLNQEKGADHVAQLE